MHDMWNYIYLLINHATQKDTFYYINIIYFFDTFLFICISATVVILKSSAACHFSGVAMEWLS